jgi:hypothetical protein
MMWRSFLPRISSPQQSFSLFSNVFRSKPIIFPEMTDPYFNEKQDWKTAQNKLFLVVPMFAWNDVSFRRGWFSHSVTQKNVIPIKSLNARQFFTKSKGQTITWQVFLKLCCCPRSYSCNAWILQHASWKRHAFKGFLESSLNLLSVLCLHSLLKCLFITKPALHLINL